MDIEKLIEQLKDLEACAFGYHINGEVLGMDCSDFEQVMVDAADALEELQAKPVVHCSDCLYLMFSDCYGECKRSYLGGIVRPDDYCSRGERKEDNTLNEIIGGGE